MAFKPNLATFGTYVGLNSIDGVQVKIGDDFIPPRKVILPMKLENSFHCHNPSEVLFMEYDFSLEESVIKWNEAYREAKKVQNCVETEKVGSDIETFMQQPQEEKSSSDTDVAADVNRKDDKREQAGCDALPDGDATGTGADEDPPPANTEDKPEENAVPVAPGLGTEILVPMQVPRMKPQESTSNGEKNESFNLADFEREKEQDPFDNAELRVLNDLEELNKVLQNAATSAASSADNISGSACAGIAVTASVANSVVSVATGHPASVTSSVASNATGVTSVIVGGTSPFQNIGGIAYYNKLAESTAVSFISQETMPGCPPIPPWNNYHPTSVKDIQYPELDSPLVIPNNSSPKQATSNPFIYSVPNSFAQPPVTKLCGTSFLHSTSCALSTFGNTGKNDVSGAVAPNNTGQHVPEMVSQTSYPFHLLSHGAAYGNMPELYATQSGRIPAGRLRAASSTPDISTLSDKMPLHTSTSQTPPPSFKPYGAQDEINKQRRKCGISDQLPEGIRSLTPPPAYEENPDSASCTSSQKMSMQSNHNKRHSLSDNACGGDVAAGSTSSLPDPYVNMSLEAKTLVDNISAMGFPRARVARVVKKHGNDDKQVIDHLCLIARLSENYPSDDVEVALNLYGNNEKKAKKYLTLITQFSELGFPAESVKDALNKSKLDENKTLDILTGNA